MIVGIVGIGKLGLELANALRSHYELILVEASDDRSQYLRANGVEVGSDFAALGSCDIVFVIVNTAIDGGYSYENVQSVLNQISCIPKPPLVVISSTCEPSFLLKLELDLRIVYNPFFVRQGQVKHDIENPDFVLIGDDNSLSQPLIDIYRTIGIAVDKMIIMTITEAAIVKLAINFFLTMKISYANLIGDLCTTCGVNPDKVLDAIGKDCRIGGKYLKYGYGFGGPCLPVDTRAMECVLRENGFDSTLPQTVCRLNEQHLDYQIERARNSGSSKIVIDRIGFKSGSDLLTNSQPLLFAVKLAQLGYNVVISESESSVLEIRRAFGEIFEYTVKKC